MVTIPNQFSVPEAFQEFDEAGRMKPGLVNRGNRSGMGEQRLSQSHGYLPDALGN
jgi:hypothetical protein